MELQFIESFSIQINDVALGSDEVNYWDIQNLLENDERAFHTSKKGNKMDCSSTTGKTRRANAQMIQIRRTHKTSLLSFSLHNQLS